VSDKRPDETARKRPSEAPIALWLAHGDNDTVVPLADGQEVRDSGSELHGGE